MHAPSTIVVDVESNYIPLPTRTATPQTDYPGTVNKVSATETSLAIPTATNTRTPLPAETLSIIGTALPRAPEQIGANNYSKLKRVGQWGRGSIQGVGFTPDGKSFIAISELGWSIYNMDALDQPPLWIGFDEPILFDEFYFDTDGTLVQFVRYDYNATRKFVKDYPFGDAQPNRDDAIWLKPDVNRKSNNMEVKSPDGTKIFHSSLIYEYDEAAFSEEKTIREMYDAHNNLLYSLKDDAPYVTYSDRNGPEGCDLSVFSPCGNALMAVATVPDKVLFSSDGSTFAALYDPPSLYAGIMRAFSYVRVYDSFSGDLIGSIGGFTKPVQDFSYSPDGKLIVVGHVDGSIVLWDVESAKPIFGARHMNAPAWEVTYSQDSKFLLIQRAEELEVRLTSNGSLVSRYATAAFAVSSVSNLLAIGDRMGNIQIHEFDTGREIMKIEAHDDRVYSIAFSADGLYLASAGQDCDIKLWDLETGKLLHYFEETAVDAYEIGMSSRIFSTHLEFVPDTNMLIGFGSWGTVVNWNVNSGATNYVIQSNALEYYNGIITLKPHFPEFFDTDVTNGIFYINDNSFDLYSGGSLGTYQVPEGVPEGCSPVGPVSGDGKLMFTRGYDNREGKVCILDAGSLSLLGEIHVMPESDTHVEWVDWLYLSPDGRQLIVTVGSGIVYVYQIV
jgi:WD40 repeat protein